MSKKSGFTQTQLLILLGMATAIIVIISVGGIYLLVKKDTLITASLPTNPPISPANLIVPPTAIVAAPIYIPPTETPVPTFVYLPTFTPMPSLTPFVVAPIVFPTQKSQQVQSNPAPSSSSGSSPSNSSPSSSATDCSAALAYAEAIHQYNLDVIDYIHSPMINYYQSLIEEAVRNRDALTLTKAQRELENEQAQVEAEKNSENKRYKAEKASINAACN
jgi:hypothetical protein